MGCSEHVADHGDVVDTYEEVRRATLEPLIVLEGLRGVIPGAGPVAVQRVGTGHSNETFRVDRGGRSWVLRRPPRRPFPPSAHDVVREHAILQALQEHDVAAPRPISLCEDLGVIGAPFYLMELVRGSVIRERFPAQLDAPQQRRQALQAFVEALVKIHAVQWEGSALEHFGRRTGYLELGAPLADVGLLCATYVQRGEEADPVLGFSPATRLTGAPTRRELIERYAGASGRDVEGLSWYQGLALWKIAILLEGSYNRYLAGTTGDRFFRLLMEGVPRVAARAWRYTDMKETA
jgi:aminoglycoside phosphotransferase (APT) family kinase protein